MKKVRWHDFLFPAFSGKDSSEEWSELKERLEVLLIQKENNKNDVIADLIQTQADELREEIESQNELIEEVKDAISRIGGGERDEALYYELFAFSTGKISRVKASHAAAVVAYKKKRKREHGNVILKKKVENILYDTEKATLACEECILREWNATVFVKRFYYQNDGCFRVAFWYSLMEVDGTAGTQKKVTITPISNDVLLNALREAKKDKSFIRDHKQVYAELLFDQK